jgi:hypothetical protein
MAYPKLFTAKAVYDFDVDGGEESAITPVHSEVIPNNAIVTKAYILTTTVGLPTTAKIAVAAGGVDIIGTATLVNDASLADEKVTEYDIADKTTASGAPTFTISVDPLTAGVYELYIQYYITGESA